MDHFKWDGDYYRDVASRADQMVAMIYDSAMSLPARYRLRIREQVAGITRNLARADVELLMGISVLRETTLTHRPSADDLEDGLTGLRASLVRSPGAEAMVQWCDLCSLEGRAGRLETLGTVDSGASRIGASVPLGRYPYCCEWLTIQ